MLSMGRGANTVPFPGDLGEGFNVQAVYVRNRAIRPSGGVNVNAAAMGGGEAGQPLYVNPNNGFYLAVIAGGR
jgi:hypothetical protein